MSNVSFVIAAKPPLHPIVAATIFYLRAERVTETTRPAEEGGGHPPRERSRWYGRTAAAHIPPVSRGENAVSEPPYDWLLVSYDGDRHIVSVPYEGPAVYGPGVSPDEAIRKVAEQFAEQHARLARELEIAKRKVSSLRRGMGLPMQKTVPVADA